MRQDTAGPPSAAPAAVPSAADTTVPTGQDTAASITPETTKTTRPGTAERSRPTPEPATPSPGPKPDTQRVKPNIDPGRTAPPPKVPVPTESAGRAGGQDTTTQSAPLRDPYHQAPRDTVSPVVYNGWKQFNLNCARCHGEDVLGTTIAPHLTESLKPTGPINTKELFIQTVCHGRPEKGMPAWCPLGLDTTKIEQIYSYVKGRSDGTIHPGRPAVRQ